MFYKKLFSTTRKYTIYDGKENNENLGHKEIVPMKTVALRTNMM